MLECVELFSTTTVLTKKLCEEVCQPKQPANNEPNLNTMHGRKAKATP